jgi:hypothetical protein
VNDPPPQIVFEEGGQFYPMVSAFMAAIPGLQSQLEPSNPMKMGEESVYTLVGKVHPELRLPTNAVRNLALAGKLDFTDIVNNLSVMLVNTAYESVKDQNDQSSEFEFFRHIRNACSHRNRFNFNDAEPRRPAKWRTLAIDHGLKGSANPLHNAQCFGPFIATADAILLLWDVEQKLQ